MLPVASCKRAEQAGGRERGQGRWRRRAVDCRLAVVSSCEMKLTAFGLQLDAINVSISDSCTMEKATARRAPAESDLDSQLDSHLDLAMAVAMAAAAAATRIWPAIGFRDRLWIWILDFGFVRCGDGIHRKCSAQWRNV